MTRIASSIATAVILILSAFQALAQEKAQISIMTYNIRLSLDSDGEHKWANRSDINCQMLDYYAPDLLGTQELCPDQLADLDAHMSDYGHVGAGRDNGKDKGERCEIFFKKTRFTLVKWGNFALSPTPEKFGEKAWDASYSRMATWVILTDNTTGKQFAYFNTHLDCDGKVARREGIKLIIEKAKTLAPHLPLIITGDFNCTAAEAPFDLLTEAGLKNVYQLSPIVYGPDFSFHDFGRAKPGECQLLDYIFVSKHFDAKRCRVIDDKPQQRYLSDHYPVISQLEL
ncbi:MAG: endonuclease/exonuclease/phosphatase family protein [Bacteroidales bacterium]|nr:endonuclease/exonuclease/phosphatase family protein [Bacteroidales bacterium]